MMFTNGGGFSVFIFHLPSRGLPCCAPVGTPAAIAAATTTAATIRDFRIPVPPRLRGHSRASRSPPLATWRTSAEVDVPQHGDEVGGEERRVYDGVEAEGAGPVGVVGEA